MECESQFDSQQLIEPAQVIDHVDAEITGAWGYFLIERGGGFSPGSSTGTYNLIDLYLYKEGE